MSQWSTTYPGLIELLETYVEDGSTEFADAVQGCVNRAEMRILRDLDIAIFNVVTNTTTSSGTASIPRSTSVKTPIKSLYFTAASEHAQRRSREYIQAHGGSGRPLYYCEDDTDIHLAPTPDDAYACAITQIVWPTKLSTDDPTNWVSENAADLLLFASLIESERFLIAPERVAEFEQAYAALLGPTRAFWRENAQTGYEPIAPAPEPERTR
jgi:hypothetical protein